MRDWYNSPAYQAILSPRTENSQSDVIFVDGVEHPHKATDVLASGKRLTLAVPDIVRHHFDLVASDELSYRQVVRTDSQRA